MKKILFLTLALVLVLALAACSSKTDGDNNPATTGGNPSSVPTSNPSQTPDNSADVEPNGDNSGWPDSTLYNIPEWKDVNEIFGSSGSLDESAGASRTIKVDASFGSLDVWLDELRGEGYAVTENKTGSKYEYEAVLSPVRIVITDDGLYFQVEFLLGNFDSWPSLNDYPINAPQPEGYEIVDVEVRFFPNEANDTGLVGSFEFTCLNMDYDAAYIYLQFLEDGGYFEPFTWKNLKYICLTTDGYFQSDDAGCMHIMFEMYLAD